jgi:hypothetical protein
MFSRFTGWFAAARQRRSFSANQATAARECVMPAALRTFVFLLLLSFAISRSAASTPQEAATEPRFDDWLIVHGKQIQFRVRIDVFLPNGQPASDLAVEAQSGNGSPDPKLDVNSNRVTAVLAAGSWGRFPALTVSTNDERFLRVVNIRPNEMRRIASMGMDLTLDPVRRALIRVVDEQETAVADATVISGPLYNQKDKTDKNGFASVFVPPDAMPGRIDVIGPDSNAARAFLKELPPDGLYSHALKVTLRVGQSQTIRLVDDQGNRVPNTPISPQPMDRSVNCIPLKGFPVHSDERGETRVVWLPHPPGDRAFIAVANNSWLEDKDNDERTPDLWTVRIKPLPRTTISGRINVPEGIPGGFLVRLTSFDHPTAHRADQLYSRADDQGNFTADVLPGSIYSVFVEDSEWASSFWDGVIVESDGTIHSPQLSIDRGIPVRIACTQGPDHTPMANTQISISSEHRFKTRDSYGQTGPTQFLMTDANGLAQALVGTGPIAARLSTLDFSDSRDLSVRPGGKNAITFHRRSVDSQTISGKLELPENMVGTTGAARLLVYASDGKSSFSKSLVASENGEFELQGIGERFVVFAMTEDERAAGFVFCNMDQTQAIEVPLVATESFRGRIVDSNGDAIGEGTISIDLRFADPEIRESPNFTHPLLMAQLDARVDENGEFEFTKLPVAVPLTLRLNESGDDNEVRQYLGQRLLSPGDERPREIFRIGAVEAETAVAPLDQRLAKMLVDCRLNQTNALIILSGKGDLSSDLVVDQILNNPDEPDVCWYFPMLVDDKVLDRDDYRDTIASRNWKSPATNQIAVVALHYEGTELGQVLLDLSDPASNQQILAFLKKHRGPTCDAREKLDSALQQARESNRKVWALVSGTRCGPCILLARWLDAHHDLLARDYVFVKIDAMRDTHGIEVTNEITGGKHQGIPFFAILDSNGNRLIDANGPLGNIGFPTEYEGKQYLRKMLEATAVAMSAAEIDELIQSLND